MIGEQTFWYFGLGEKSNPIPLLVPGDDIVTGGISPELSCGGGCCHWGSGPARRSVCRSGPASITACRNLPFSGNGFLRVATGGGGGEGTKRMLSSESEWDKWSTLLLVVVVGLDEIGQSNNKLCFLEELAKIKCFSSSRFWHLAWNWSLSLMILASKSLRWRISSSFLEISSWAERIAASSSTLEYNRECFNSSTPYFFLKTHTMHILS